MFHLMVPDLVVLHFLGQGSAMKTPSMLMLIIHLQLRVHLQHPNALPMGIAPAVSVTTVSAQIRMAGEAEERWEVILLYW
jgi:hypothetical protein